MRIAHRTDRNSAGAALLACLTLLLCPMIGAAQSSASAGPLKVLVDSPMLSLPPAIGPTCQSIPLTSPDNHCAVHYVQTRGDGWNAQTSAHIKCEWADSGTFEEEILRIFSADQSMHLRWLDSKTLEVGLLKDVGFSPPPDRAEHFGHSIRFVYRAMSREDLGPVQCFDQPEDFRNWRELYRPRAAGQAGWVTYGSEQTCLLAGNFAVSASNADSIPMHFTKTSTARLPDGTTELVLSMTSQQALPQVPRIVLPPKTQLLVLQQGGAINRYRLVGAEAERVLDQFARAGEVRLSLMDEQGAARSVDVAHEDFAAAYAAFEKCLGTLGAP